MAIAEKKKKSIIFIICPIKEPESDTRKRSDKVKKYIIEPMGKELNYEVTRSDLIADPGKIDEQIVEHLLNDDLIIADITDHNPNVFYELAIRHMIGKPVILLGEKDWRPPFDVYTQRVISYDLTDPEKIDESKEELKKQIKNVEDHKFVVGSPIKIGQQVKPQEKKGINEMEIYAMLRTISDRVSNVENILTEKPVNRSAILEKNMEIKRRKCDAILSELSKKGMKVIVANPKEVFDNDAKYNTIMIDDLEQFEKDAKLFNNVIYFDHDACVIWAKPIKKDEIYYWRA